MALAGAAGAVLGALVAGAACITTPPPALPTEPCSPPTILRASVTPSPDVPYLAMWPADDLFTIPVRVQTPGEGFYYQIVYDPMTPDEVDILPDGELFPSDGGVYWSPPFNLAPPANPYVCPHRIVFMVANGFAAKLTPNACGGDSVTWFYDQGGGVEGCAPFDAGTGAFPDASDAAIDALQPVGGDP